MSKVPLLGCPHSGRRSIPRAHSPPTGAWRHVSITPQRGLDRLSCPGPCAAGGTSRLRRGPGLREGQLDDLADDGAELLQQRAAVVGDAVALADLLHLG